MLKEYRISHKTVDQICAIVDADDSVNDLLPPPEAAEPDTICRGLTKVLGNGYKAIEMGAVIFEARYTQLAEQG